MATKLLVQVHHKIQKEEKKKGKIKREKKRKIKREEGSKTRMHYRQLYIIQQELMEYICYMKKRV